ncbi:hypothetical protein BDW75DRAFT_151874 [Aspergillus navahoensis]
MIFALLSTVTFSPICKECSLPALSRRKLHHAANGGSLLADWQWQILRLPDHLAGSDHHTTCGADFRLANSSQEGSPPVFIDLALSARVYSFFFHALPLCPCTSQPFRKWEPVVVWPRCALTLGTYQPHWRWSQPKDSRLLYSSSGRLTSGPFLTLFPFITHWPAATTAFFALTH